MDSHDKSIRSHDLNTSDVGGSAIASGDQRFDQQNLQGTDFQNSDLRAATFYGADVRDADFREVSGLHIGQFAGANLAGTKFPEDVQFDARLERAEKLGNHSSLVFLGLLFSSIYSLLTIASTTDQNLLTNSASSTLPFIETPVPILWFFFLEPLILLCIYLYFQFSLQNVWEEIAELPAVFPENLPLHRKLNSWLLIELPLRHLSVLRPYWTVYTRARYLIFTLLIDWIAPLTLLIFWLRYLPRQDFIGTLFLTAILLSAYTAQRLFSQRTRNLFLLGCPKAQIMLSCRTYREIGIILLLVPLFCALALFAIQGKRRPAGVESLSAFYVVPELLTALGFSPFADLRGTELSSPVSLQGEIGLDKRAIARARFAGRNLRFANLADAYLARADLLRTDLEGAILIAASAESAVFNRACLRQTRMDETNLRNASLQFSLLSGASFESADLRGANLSFALMGEDTSWLNANLEGSTILRPLCDTPPPPDSAGNPCGLIGNKLGDRDKIAVSCHKLARNLCNAQSLYGARIDRVLLDTILSTCPEKLMKMR